ncbi:hypothetical protein FQN57_000536 [Myotisia sp. PD_48]|nr:hypothetical protein FQN57_000536 [Myotisia sp. PD_48]
MASTSRKDEENNDGTTTVSVNIKDFTRTRDNVIVSLAALQSAVSDLSRAYINHANTVLNREPGPVSSIDIGGITNSLFENGLLSNQRGADALLTGQTTGKRRAKRPHDPNAPKRALTSYFLYMQHERANIARELGPNTTAKEVADEGTRRWTEMNENDRKKWKDLYALNLGVYKQKMQAYKAGLPIPANDDAADLAAQQLQHSVHQTTQEPSSDEDSDSSSDESPSPAKEPTPPRSHKRRRESKVVPPAPSTPAPKSSKKKSKAEEKKAALATPEPPKSEKKPRKKRKSTVDE